MLNLKTGKHFTDAPMTRRNVLTGLGGIIAAGCAPSIALGAARIVSRDALAGSANATVGGMMRNVGARNAAMFIDGKQESDWIDGYYVTNRGVITPYEGRSVSNAMAFPNGKNIRYSGSLQIWVVGFYKSNGNYWNDVIISNRVSTNEYYRDWQAAGMMFYRYSTGIDHKLDSYVYNLTDDEYVMKDGVIEPKYKYAIA